MARVSYTGLPPEGAKNERDVARTVNQILGGFQNCVLDIEIPAGGLDSGSFTVNDLRISQQKWIDLIPTDLNGVLLADDLFITNLQNGSFDLGVVPQEFQGSAMQVRGSGVGPNLLVPTAIPFQSVDFDINFTAAVDPVNTVTVLTNGLQQISFTISGVYGTGTDFIFGVRVIAGPNIGGEFVVATSTGGGGQGNDTVSLSGAIIASLEDGDVLEFFGDATTSNLLSPYALNWSMLSEGAFPLEPGAGPFNFRALIIG